MPWEVTGGNILKDKESQWKTTRKSFAVENSEDEAFIRVENVST